jgi:hypothetical protein
MKSSELRASELRVGNITTLGVVSLIDQDVFRVVDSEGDSFKNTWAEIKPIPLTEEWLLKFGFVSNPYKDRYELIAKINIIIECDKTKGLIDLYCEQFPHIKYVHSLQNLYFALTGEELKEQER